MLRLAKLRSLSGRIITTATLLLFVMLIGLGFMLEAIHRDSGKRAFKQQLILHFDTLQAGTEIDMAGSVIGTDSQRFASPDSGVFGFVQTQMETWASPSTIGSELQPPPADAKLTQDQTRLQTNWDFDAEPPVLYLSNTVTWTLGTEDEQINSDAPPKRQPVRFVAASNLTPLLDNIAQYRRYLISGIIVTALFFALVQIVLLRGALGPLRQVADDVKTMESGDNSLLDGEYPRELAGLVDNLNALMISERQNLERYRNALGDLAHSLKTPLAVLRTKFTEAEHPDEYAQTQRMQEIVDYHLGRAAAAGRAAVGKAEPILPVIERIVSTLEKVYAAQNMQFVIDVDDDQGVKADEGDLMEIFGNLLDNACKYGSGTVIISAHSTTLDVDEGLQVAALEIVIEDNGKGIPDDLAASVTERGKRLQVDLPGQGLGLNLVQDIVRLYRGEMQFGASQAIGGAAVRLTLPS